MTLRQRQFQNRKNCSSPKKLYQTELENSFVTIEPNESLKKSDKKIFFLITVNLLILTSLSPVYSQCNMMLISDSYSQSYLTANPINKIMGCDFYKELSAFDYAGAIAKWYYSDSVAKPLDVWKYTDTGILQPYLYAGADYVIYAIGKNDTAIMLNCEAYDSINQLINDHESFISKILIEQLGYRRDQIILFFTGPVSYERAGNIEGETVEDCRPDGIADEECVLQNSSYYGWQCEYTNRHLKLVTDSFKELAQKKGMPFADMFSWVIENYPDNPDEFFQLYDAGDGIHVDVARNNFFWWNTAVDLIEEAIFNIQDPDLDGVPHAQDNCPNNYNTQQIDVDNDGIGDVCDPDTIYGNISGNFQEGTPITIYTFSCGELNPHASTFTNSEGYYSFGNLDNALYFIFPGDDYTCSSSFWALIPQEIVQPYDFTATIPLEAEIE